MNILPEFRTKPSSVRDISGRIGTLTTRLAQSKNEIITAQRIRYQVFCEEMSAKKNVARRITKRDTDAHDIVCDHLLVIDNSEAREKIIGTQRFFVKNSADKKGVFYSQSEFDLEGLAARHPDKNFMELGRSCILPEYRTKRTMELMWHGTWAYALNQKADVMVGCASFEATSFDEISVSLGFLAKHAACDEEWNAQAIKQKATSLAEFWQDDLNPKRALAALPPLIKGYLRLGAKFSSHAVLDQDFGTIDVLVILPIANINPRYVNYYGADASRHKK